MFFCACCSKNEINVVSCNVAEALLYKEIRKILGLKGKETGEKGSEKAGTFTHPKTKHRLHWPRGVSGSLASCWEKK
jgi:hypothetical protein